MMSTSASGRSLTIAVSDAHRKLAPTCRHHAVVLLHVYSITRKAGGVASRSVGKAGGVDGVMQSRHDQGDLVWRDLVVERERDRAVGDRLGDRERTGAIPELRLVERLQVDRLEVVVRADAVA